jgi:hypothetical protein
MRVRYARCTFVSRPNTGKRTLVQRSDSVAEALCSWQHSKTNEHRKHLRSELNKSGYIGEDSRSEQSRPSEHQFRLRLQLYTIVEDSPSPGAHRREHAHTAEGNTAAFRNWKGVHQLSSRSLPATLAISLIHDDSEFELQRKLSGVLGEGAIRGGTASLSYASLKGHGTACSSTTRWCAGSLCLTGRNGDCPCCTGGHRAVNVDVCHGARENND